MLRSIYLISDLYKVTDIIESVPLFLHATKPDFMIFDVTSAICDDKFAMCYPCKLTLKEVAA